MAGAPVVRGTLVLVVGPSGAGKDALIGWCRARLAGDPSVVFPRRVITRPADGASEDHDPVTEAAFETLAARHAFALHWRAHGLAYGVPATIAADLAAGRTVVVNVSRAVLDAARDAFPPVRIVAVGAPPAVLAERLRGRSRETGEDIARRLARPLAAPAGPDVVMVDNSGDLATAGARLLDIVLRG